MEKVKSYWHMCFSTAAFDSEFMWAINDEDGGLYRIDRITYETQLQLIAIPEKRAGFSGYAKAEILEDNIFFFPYETTYPIMIYDMKNNSTEFVPFGKKIGSVFLDIVIDEKTAYLVSVVPKLPLICFEMTSKKFSYDYGWIKNIEKYWNKEDQEEVLYRGMVLHHHKLWIAIYHSQWMIEVDLKDGNRIRAFEIKGYQLGALAFDGELFWISLANRYAVISWNPVDYSTKLYESSQTDEIESIFLPYIRVICTNQEVFLLPMKSVFIERVDQEQGNITKLQNFPDGFYIFPNRYDGYSFYTAQVLENQIWVFPISGNMLLSIDVRTLEITGHKLLIPSAEILFEQYYLKRNNLAYETNAEDVYLLDHYCDLFQYFEEKTITQEEKQEVSNNGLKIYEYIRGELEK